MKVDELTTLLGSHS